MWILEWHINWHNTIFQSREQAGMNVRLAVQLFSNTVAKALLHCEENNYIQINNLKNVCTVYLNNYGTNLWFNFLTFNLKRMLAHHLFSFSDSCA